MEKLTQAQVLGRLEEAALSLTETAVMFLDTRQSRGSPISCAAVVVHYSGRIVMLGIGDASMRLQILKEYTRATGDVAGFTLVFDGYVTKVCRSLSKGECRDEGCEACRGKGVIRPRIDAIIAVVRTVWGQGITKSVAYAYPDGKFALRPDRDEDSRHEPGSTLDNYDTVFRDVSVN